MTRLRSIKHFKMSSIVMAFVLLMALLDYSFFNMIKMPDFITLFSRNWRKYFMIPISLVLCFVTYYKNGIPRNSFLTKYFIGLFFSFLFLVTFSLWEYGEQLIRIIVLAPSHYLILSLTVVLLWLFNVKNEYYSLMNLINRFIFVWYAIIILQSVFYTMFETVFLLGDMNFRDGNIRIGLGSLGNIMILYNFDVFICKRDHEKRLFALLQTILGIYSLIFVQQTRAFTVIIFITMSMIPLINCNTICKTLKTLVIISTILFILANLGILESFFSSFSPYDEKRGYSTLARMEATLYYLESFKNNILYAQGIGAPEHIQMGDYGGYSDLGIISSFAQFGLFTIINLHMAAYTYG